ncbi:hypothetical protein MJA45_18930 [Paenibacillus aurantius]|uniref:DUF4340 domain-containing protein n=1 Tax=Paenibacillus aurantius TaxID=2918900 RepID=A0AA96LAM0_9BACL|nr:hypothetical protein [Paenibacillus aurantius]WNQ09690.1 hypothetical protein MJA45_18930 [Paenibacillus aurantius]
MIKAMTTAAVLLLAGMSLLSAPLGTSQGSLDQRAAAEAGTAAEVHPSSQPMNEAGSPSPAGLPAAEQAREPEPAQAARQGTIKPEQPSSSAAAPAASPSPEAAKTRQAAAEPIIADGDSALSSETAGSPSKTPATPASPGDLPSAADSGTGAPPAGPGAETDASEPVQAPVPAAPAASAAKNGGAAPAVPVPGTEKPAASTSLLPPAPADFDKQVAEWIRSLSAEPGFEAWLGAKWERVPLGPGTHSWLVTVLGSDGEAGYLVVHAAADGSLVLGEYGTGDKPLFSMRTLYQSMMQHALLPSSLTYEEFAGSTRYRKERMYLLGPESFWKVTSGSEIYYFDAKSGDRLLDLTKLNPGARQAPEGGLVQSSRPAQVTGRLSLEAFDPFLLVRWVSGQPLAVTDPASLKKTLTASSSMTYNAKLFNNQALYPFAVTGYQEWSDATLYVALDQEGTRYLPLSVLVTLGKFY